MTKDNYLMHIINSINNSLSQAETGIIINELVELGIVEEETEKLLRVATNDKVLNLPNEYKDEVRTRLLKNMLLNLI